MASSHYETAGATFSKLRPARFSGRTIIALAVILSGRSHAQETNQIPLPEVSVTAPAPRSEPPYLRDPWKSYERNPYDGRYRVEEDKFPKVPCSETRIAFGSGGTCLKGYRLATGCDMVLDVVSYTNESLAIEADTLVFDPYKLFGGGHISSRCCVNSHRSYDQEDFQDMNQVTRRGANWHDFFVDGTDGQNRSIEFMDGPHHCIAILRHGRRWQGGYVYMMHASICRTDAASVQPQDVNYVIGSLRVQEYDPVGNIRPPPRPAAATLPTKRDRPRAEPLSEPLSQCRVMPGVAGGTYLFGLSGTPSACRDAREGILVHQLKRFRPCNFVELTPRACRNI